MRRLKRNPVYVDLEGFTERFPSLANLGEDAMSELIVRAEQAVDNIVGWQDKYDTEQYTHFPRKCDVIEMESVGEGGVDTVLQSGEYVLFDKSGTWQGMSVTSGQYGLRLSGSYYVEDTEPTTESTIPYGITEGTYLILDIIKPSEVTQLPKGLSVRLGAATIKNNVLKDDDPATFREQLLSTEEGRRALSFLLPFRSPSYKIT